MPDSAQRHDPGSGHFADKRFIIECLETFQAAAPAHNDQEIILLRGAVEKPDSFHDLENRPFPLDAGRIKIDLKSLLPQVHRKVADRRPLFRSDKRYATGKFRQQALSLRRKQSLVFELLLQRLISFLESSFPEKLDHPNLKTEPAARLIDIR